MVYTHIYTNVLKDKRTNEKVAEVRTMGRSKILAYILHKIKICLVKNRIRLYLGIEVS